MCKDCKRRELRLYVNSQCELFKLGILSIDMFKCLIFVSRLIAVKNKDIRSMILTIIEQDPEITPKKVTEECKRLINVKRSNTQIEDKNLSRFQAIKPPKFTISKAKTSQCDASGVLFKTGLFLKEKAGFKCGYVSHKRSNSHHNQKTKKQNLKTKVVFYPRAKLEMVKKYVNTKIIGHTVK